MNIYEKLAVIQQKLKAPKNKQNNFGGYAYRSAENILENLKPLLLETKTTLTISDSIDYIEGRFYVMATATLIDTEKPEDRIVNFGCARESEEKRGVDSSQITGASSSYARKYCLCGLFAVDSMPPDADAWADVNGQPQNATKGKRDKAEPKKESAPAPAKPEPKKETDIATTATLNYLKRMIVKYAYRDFGGQILAHYGVQALEDMTPDQLAKAAKQAEAYNAAHMDEKEAKENE